MLHAYDTTFEADGASLLMGGNGGCVPTTRCSRDQGGGGGTTLVEGGNGGRVACLRHDVASCRSCVMSEDVSVNVEYQFSKKNVQWGDGHDGLSPALLIVSRPCRDVVETANDEGDGWWCHHCHV